MDKHKEENTMQRQDHRYDRLLLAGDPLGFLFAREEIDVDETAFCALDWSQRGESDLPAENEAYLAGLMYLQYLRYEKKHPWCESCDEPVIGDDSHFTCEAVEIEIMDDEEIAEVALNTQ